LLKYQLSIKKAPGSTAIATTSKTFFCHNGSYHGGELSVCNVDGWLGFISSSTKDGHF